MPPAEDAPAEPRILLTNDDGIDSTGLHAVRDALMQSVAHVTTLAPERNHSGGARSATFWHPVVVQRRPSHDDDPMYACRGTPVDCVRAGLLSAIGDGVALVVSGINRGANLGDDSTYSSTVGAGIEAALLGVPALCVSQQSRDGLFRLVDRTDFGFEVSSRLAAVVAAAMLRQPPPGRAVVNLNVPAVLTDPCVEVTRLGHRYYERGSLLPVAVDGDLNGYQLFDAGHDGESAFEDTPGTDFAALRRGRASLTPLAHDWGDPRHAERLHEWSLVLVAAVEEEVAALGGFASSPRH